VIEPRRRGRTIAAQAVAGAPPDGYTFAARERLLHHQHRQGPKHRSTSAATLRRLCCATVPFVLVVHPSVEAKNLAELVTLAKARARQAQLCVLGIGTPPHLAGELFKSMAGIDVVHVPFREANSALNAVVSGAVEMMFSIASTAARR
jgi:tripartite-type tricarboxylate transporter receptor subunit TctC